MPKYATLKEAISIGSLNRMSVEEIHKLANEIHTLATCAYKNGLVNGTIRAAWRKGEIEYVGGDGTTLKEALDTIRKEDV